MADGRYSYETGAVSSATTSATTSASTFTGRATASSNDVWYSVTTQTFARDVPETQIWQRLVIPEPVELSYSHETGREFPSYQTRMETNEELQGRIYRDQQHHLRELETRDATRKKSQEKQEAEARARDLLVAVLDDEQEKEFEEHGYFHVVFKKRKFQIRNGRTHNIHEYDENGIRVAKICCHVEDKVPNFDNMAVQKLWLETDPQTFLETANIHNW
jgi:hypothetical protein